MRIDARNPGARLDWTVWHCEECRIVPYVVWVDDTTNQWGECVCVQRRDPLTPMVCRDKCDPIPRQVRKIQIILDSRLVLINPLEDFDEEGKDELAYVLLQSLERMRA